MKVTRRHQPPGKRKRWDQGYTKCNWPVLIRGTLNGKRLTLAASKFLRPPFDRDLGRARELARSWEQAGRVIPLAEFESKADP